MKTDNQQLFLLILEKNKRRLAAIARSYAAAEDCEDLCQEILLQVWRSLDSFEGRAALDTWVFRVALNTAMTYRRKEMKRTRHIESHADLSELPAGAWESEAGHERELQLLRDFVVTLKKIDRALFLLYLENLSYEQISEITGLSENNVGVRINRIKQNFIERHIGG